MFSYAGIYGLYYAIVLLALAPWGMLFLGALRAVRRRGGRLRRMQVEGAALILAGSLAKWMVFDPLFGFDRLRSAIWSYWFARGEVGFFLIGLLLFTLGFFLERRPRPGLIPWPSTVKSVCITGILLGAGLGLLAFKWSQYPWLHLPWTLPRVVFSLGMFPFAAGYLVLGRRLPDPPADLFDRNH
jgi:hypothetical protein